jgi:uncharacterized protein YdhG (YjbR/CyaY superfamily)
MSTNVPATIDAYLEKLPSNACGILTRIRDMIAKIAPDALEGIKYSMPTATLFGTNIIYYAAWKRHVALYPIYRGESTFEATIAPYRDKKDTVRFSLSQPVPYDIIELIIQTRVSALQARENNK